MRGCHWDNQNDIVISAYWDNNNRVFLWQFTVIYRYLFPRFAYAIAMKKDQETQLKENRLLGSRERLMRKQSKNLKMENSKTFKFALQLRKLVVEKRSLVCEDAHCSFEKAQKLATSIASVVSGTGELNTFRGRSCFPNETLASTRDCKAHGKVKIDIRLGGRANQHSCRCQCSL